jgi:hypothetical protein
MKKILTEKELFNFLRREKLEREKQEKFKEIFGKTYISNSLFNRSGM